MDSSDEGDLFAEADRFVRRRFSLRRRFAMFRDRRYALKERPRSRILSIATGTPISSKRLCLFSHFDPQGRIDPYVLHYLRCIRDSGFETVLSSASPSLDPRDVDRAREICRMVIHRSNLGLDFGGWHDALGQVGPPEEYDELLLTNDSVYGPLLDIGEVFSKMEGRLCDFWGLTDCFVMGRHVQSYFLLLRKRVLTSATFQGFWKDFIFYCNKDNVIRDYEVGLTRRLEQAGFRFDVLCRAQETDVLDSNLAPGEDLVDARARGLAYTSSTPISLWKALILRQGFPFVKRELVRDNPYRLTSVRDLSKVIAAAGTYDIELIRAHLRRLGARAEI